MATRVPGVERASLAQIVPLAGERTGTEAAIEDGKMRDYFGNAVSPNYFATMSIPIIAGRDFDVRDNAGDGIHGASAGGLWQAVVFGFAGLEQTEDGWRTNPHLPKNWIRVAFNIVDHGKRIHFDVTKDS